jgi:hypothetical protein
MHHPRCVGSVTKNFLCITHTVEHNYISSSSTVGYNYMFRPYMWAIFRLWFILQSSYTRCVGCSFRVLGDGWGERDLIVSIVGTMTYDSYNGTHYWNNEILFPPPNPQYPKRTPHTSCIAALWVKPQPEGGPHIGAKHVVVFLLYY